MISKQELLDQISALPDDIAFLVASDEEGNSFHELAELSPGWSIEDGYEWEPVHSDDYKEYIDDGRILTKVAIFWP